MKIEEARGIAAQAWCEPANSQTEMDSDLAEAFAEILIAQVAAERERCVGMLALSNPSKF